MAQDSNSDPTDSGKTHSAFDSTEDSRAEFGVDRPIVAVTRYSKGPASGLNRQLTEARQGLRADFIFNQPSLRILAGVAVGGLVIGLATGWAWLGIPAAIITLFLAAAVLWPSVDHLLNSWLTGRVRSILLASLATLLAIAGLLTLAAGGPINRWVTQINWDAVGALAELFGAIGQIFVAFLALYVAWRQYVISKDLTSQQNRITQQQTIDTYFQGISDLVLDEEGLLEDWPPERAIAEGRTAAILSGVDAEGKAKIVRFLSSSKLLTPLKRDRRLGRPIFDGLGGYAEDIEFGVRVIDLGSMLAGADLGHSDLRATDLSEANLVSTNLSDCDFTRANLSRVILYEANLRGSDFSRTRFFYGAAETATPRDRVNPPDYTTGAQTGAVVENADLTGAHGLSSEQCYYFCAWGGSKTRETIPGGCQGIPNKLGR